MIELTEKFFVLLIQCEGLRMVDSYTSAVGLPNVWINYSLDDSFNSLWKSIEVTALADFHCDVDIFVPLNNVMPRKLLSFLGKEFWG